MNSVYTDTGQTVTVDVKLVLVRPMVQDRISVSTEFVVVIKKMVNVTVWTLFLASIVLSVKRSFTGLSQVKVATLVTVILVRVYCQSVIR